MQSVFNGAQVFDKSGNAVTEATLQANKVVCIYFSAHWCPPCRNFTPVLIEFYNKCKADGKSLEIVFVSSDRDEPSFTDYWASQPWAAVKFGDANIAAIKSKFSVTGIPKLVVLNGSTGATLVDNARGDVQNMGPDAFEGWAASC